MTAIALGPNHANKAEELHAFFAMGFEAKSFAIHNRDGPASIHKLKC
jgi:hypothetical protein